MPIKRPTKVGMGSESCMKTYQTANMLLTADGTYVVVSSSMNVVEASDIINGSYGLKNEKESFNPGSPKSSEN